MTDSISPERLASLFRSKSFALIGASDRSSFSQTAFSHLVSYGLEDRTFLVNPRTTEVHGRATFPNVGAIGRPVDVAYIMLPQPLVETALIEAAEAGVPHAMVLSSGYAETGPEGRAAQERLVAKATELGVLLLGPNHLGFMNFIDGVPVSSIPQADATPGPVAFLTQSGASARAMLEFAFRAGIGLSHVVTLGNEAMITAGDVLDFLVDDPNTGAVALYLEEIRRTDVFARAARRAAEAGKAVVVLKTGASRLAAETAAAHTGAFVGDDRVVDAVLRQLGVIRVGSVEDLLVTANIAAHVGRLPRPGVGVVSISGGACNIIADRAEDLGLELPPLAAETIEKLDDALPDYGSARNPLDVTGASVLDPTIFTRAIKAMGEDPGIGLVAVVHPLPGGDEPVARVEQPRIDAIAEGMASIDVPGVFANQVLIPVDGSARYALDSSGIGWSVAGLRELVVGLRGVAWWSEACRRLTGREEHEAAPPPQVPAPSERRGRWSEARTLRMIESAGIGVVPTELARTADDAVAAAARLGEPVAMKIVSADIPHKSDIGGVRLDIVGEAAVREAYAAVLNAGSAVPGARLDGVAVSPMRRGGTELLLGVVRDPHWGPILALAFGGIYTEILQDSALAPLPLTHADARRLIASLRGHALLEGARGGTAADLDELAATIVRFGDLARALGDDLESLEINPLRVDGDRVEALDGLVTWSRP